jgi:hypothetical protein
MKKLVLLILVSISLTSCTIEDVLAYLSGNSNNLTCEEKEQIDTFAARDTEPAALLTTTTTPPPPIEDDRDKGGGRP